MTHARARLTVSPGERVYGYFYTLFWDREDPDCDTLFDDFNAGQVDRTRRLEVEVLDISDVTAAVRPGCSASVVSHAKWILEKTAEVEIRRDGDRTGLVYCFEEAYMFMGGPLVSAIVGNGFHGLVPHRVKTAQFSEDTFARDELFLVDGRTNPITPLTILPEECNYCRACGALPLVCPVCSARKRNAHDQFVCWTCDTPWFGTSGGNAVENCIEQRFDSVTPAVELSKWDGSDFLEGMIVTRRVVDFLCDVQPGSFRAEGFPFLRSGNAEADNAKLALAVRSW